MLSLFSSVSVTGCPIRGHSVFIERLNDSLRVIFHERFQAECSFVPMLLWLSGLFSLVCSFVRVAQRTRVGVGKGVSHSPPAQCEESGVSRTPPTVSAADANHRGVGPLHLNVPGPRDALSACLFTAYRLLCQASRGACPPMGRATSPWGLRVGLGGL